MRTRFVLTTIFLAGIGHLIGGQNEADLGQVGFLAAEATAQAIVRAVKTALGARRMPAHYDLKRMQG